MQEVNNLLSKRSEYIVIEIVYTLLKFNFVK